MVFLGPCNVKFHRNQGEKHCQSPELTSRACDTIPSILINEHPLGSGVFTCVKFSRFMHVQSDSASVWCQPREPLGGIHMRSAHP